MGFIVQVSQLQGSKRDLRNGLLACEILTYYSSNPRSPFAEKHRDSSLLVTYDQNAKRAVDAPPPPHFVRRAFVAV